MWKQRTAAQPRYLLRGKTITAHRSATLPSRKHKSLLHGGRESFSGVKPAVGCGGGGEGGGGVCVGGGGVGGGGGDKKIA